MAGHTTIRDLVQACPGCGGTVSWPYTQDPLAELREMRKTGRRRSLDRYKINETEEQIMKSLGYEFDEAFSVGTIIKTVRTESGKLWHEPCYVVRYAREWQKHVQHIVDLLTWRIHVGTIPEV